MPPAIIVDTTAMTGMITRTGTITMTDAGTSIGTGTVNSTMGTVAGNVAVPDTAAASAILGTCTCVLPLPCATAAGYRENRKTVPHTGYSPGTALENDMQNNQALDRFFAEHEDKAFYVAYAALWDRESALDAVQESMLKLVEYYRNKPAEDWPALFRTVLNSKINDIRRKRLLEQGKHRLVSLTGLFRNRREKDDEEIEFELPSSERTDGITGPETGYVASELRNHIDRALQALSERQRQVFILREWRGMSISETAITLGCSENSIKQHHFRAMRELRKQLAEVWDHAQPSTS
jgi:RNA polymerase sigma-70 factor (ECF subfamily)